MKRKLQLLVYSLLGFLYMAGIMRPFKWSWGDKPAKYLLQMLYSEIKSKYEDVPGMCGANQGLLERGLLNKREYYRLDMVLDSKKPSINTKYSHYTKDLLWLNRLYWWPPYTNKPRLEFLKEVIKNEY